jgi:integrase
VNPCERGGRLYSPDRVDAIWTEDLIGRASKGLPPELRWALVLGLSTGQRQGDLLRLPWSAYDGDLIRFRQSKTGRRLLIPASSQLKAELATIPRIATVILTNTEGKPWTSDGFRSSWRKAVSRLGITGLTFHDLRGSAVTRLAEAGCTESEIAAITGHSHQDVGAMLDRHYLSRTNTLADNAIRRLERMERERKL